jgi:hypothetical protein
MFARNSLWRASRLQPIPSHAGLLVALAPLGKCPEEGAEEVAVAEALWGRDRQLDREFAAER